MATYSHYGFATVSTDTGHDSSVLDGSWALNEPEQIIDWGFRAMHGSIVLAKAIVSTYYGGHDSHQSVIQRPYYAGCSTGGRQGLKEIEMYLEDFDGVLAGAPAWWTNHL
jgi:feruloyl esterase